MIGLYLYRIYLSFKLYYLLLHDVLALLVSIHYELLPELLDSVEGRLYRILIEGYSKYLAVSFESGSVLLRKLVIAVIVDVWQNCVFNLVINDAFYHDFIFFHFGLA